MREGGVFSSPARVYVDGPRKGQTEKISDREFDEYRQHVEKEWGKYIPGTLWSEPKFVPGRQRDSVPYIIFDDGVPFEAGVVDKNGVWYHPTRKPVPQ